MSFDLIPHRFKEGRILGDSLTTAESCRFHIAAYLFCHYQAVWRSFQSFYLGIDPTEHAGEAAEIQDALTVDACYSYITGLSTKELCWMQEFKEFLLHDIDMDFKDDTESYVLAANGTYIHDLPFGTSIIPAPALFSHV